MRDRNWRRGQRERIWARAKKRILERDARWDNGWWEDHPEDLAAAIGREARTPHPCSRYCCGNPRHHWNGFEKFTMQEHRWFQSAHEQEIEAHNDDQETNNDVDGGGEAIS